MAALCVNWFKNQLCNKQGIKSIHLYKFKMKLIGTGLVSQMQMINMQVIKVSATKTESKQALSYMSVTCTHLL